MDTTKDATRIRKSRKVKIDRDKVLELNKQGLNCTDIAKHQGVAVSTITRFLDSIDLQLQAVKRFTNRKADALALNQLKCAAVSNLLLDEWLNNPEDLLKQDHRLRKEVLVGVQGAKTYDFNSERLERGQATAITDVRALIVELDAAEAAAMARLRKPGIQEG
jgi:intein-encoded DNA endonuclease-like protein